MRSAKEIRKMTRPVKREPRIRQLNLSLTDSELDDIRRRAEAVGMRPVHFGRALIFNQKSVPATTSTPAANVQRLIYGQLSRLGNNLNQLVRHCHQTGDPLPPDLEPLLNDIRQIIARLSE
jgi:hypothetical protein